MIDCNTEIYFYLIVKSHLSHLKSGSEMTYYLLQIYPTHVFAEVSMGTLFQIATGTTLKQVKLDIAVNSYMSL